MKKIQLEFDMLFRPATLDGMEVMKVSGNSKVPGTMSSYVFLIHNSV